MCGVYGFAGKPTKATNKILKKLAIINITRGADSSGLAFITPKGHVLHKNTVNSYDFFKEKTTQKLLGMSQRSKYLIVLGHTRAATRGAITAANAHPFKTGNILFTHNGIISNFDQLQAQYDTTLQVDSEIIGHLLHKKGASEAVKEIGGSYAVPFVDINEPDMLQVIVHTSPFSFAVKGNQIFYSSVFEHLKQALKHEKGWTFTKAKDNNLYKFYTEAWSHKVLYSRQKIEPKKVDYSATYGGYYGGSYYGIYSNDDYYRDFYKPKNYSHYQTKKTVTALVGTKSE